MRKGLIGQAELASGELEQPDDGVSFRLPYGDKSFDIVFSDTDINKLLNLGLIRLMGREAVSGHGFDFDVRLPLPDLPVFVGLDGITTEENNGGRQAVELAINVVTLSVIESQESRGVLKVNRPAWAEHWEYSDYLLAAPLEDMEVALSRE